MQSLSARLLLSVSALLLFFFGLTGIVLDTAFRRSAERAIWDRLDVHVTALLSAAELSGDGTLAIPDALPEARFSNPGSGLFGGIVDGGGDRVWRSDSAVGLDFPVTAALAPGERRFSRTALGDEAEVFALDLGVDWELDDETLRAFTISVAESQAPYQAQVSRFRRQLFGWFALLTILLLAAQAMFLRRILSPLRRVETEIHAIETGDRRELGGGYPRELRGVRRNMNALIRSERARLVRYRNTLGNLAHSLKTPLAVLRTEIETGGERETLDEQVQRIDDIIGYQLQRAAASGGTALGHAPVAVADTVPRIVNALAKVYAAKGVQVEQAVDPKARFFGDAGDLTEIIGNLLDNAHKFCQKRVVVTVTVSDTGDTGGARPGIEIVVDDDGPGISERDRERVLERGVRMDERTPGTGLGLAVVKEIVEIADGTIRLDASPLGGARVSVQLPGR